METEKEEAYAPTSIWKTEGSLSRLLKVESTKRTDDANEEDTYYLSNSENDNDDNEDGVVTKKGGGGSGYVNTDKHSTDTTSSTTTNGRRSRSTREVGNSRKDLKEEETTRRYQRMRDNVAKLRIFLTIFFTISGLTNLLLLFAWVKSTMTNNAIDKGRTLMQRQNDFSRCQKLLCLTNIFIPLILTTLYLDDGYRGGDNEKMV